MVAAHVGWTACMFLQHAPVAAIIGLTSCAGQLLGISGQKAGRNRVQEPQNALGAMGSLCRFLDYRVLYLPTECVEIDTCQRTGLDHCFANY